VLNLSKKGDHKVFSKADLKYLNALLTHISFAVENARLLKEAKDATQKLQQVVGEQSLQLVEIQQQALQSMELFHQAQKIEAMGTLAGGIAHDFNNLLMGIQGRASLMLMDIDPSHLFYEHLKGIEEHVISAADLTKQLLGFARRGKYEVKSTDLNELLKKTSRMFGRTKKEIKIHCRFQEDLWAVEVDQGQIEQVMMNLYVNAWQAMPGSGNLNLETQNVRLEKDFSKLFAVEEGNYVKISVTDNGIGMEEATRQRIFEPFYTTKEMGRGTGLGLASTYGIVKNHDGIINVYSEKGFGTTFNIYLPASDKRVMEEKTSIGEIVEGTEMILLVDDEDMIVSVGEQILKRLGYRVKIAKSGKEAIEIYKRNQDRIDMVILDMIMPDVGGKMAYEKLKEINPGIKVLLSSGYSLTGQAQEILDKGCNGFIQKPFNLKDLSLKLREILDEG
jgi:two-component system, cell cycle sensor histidine kinase and response regulator CckA